MSYISHESKNWRDMGAEELRYMLAPVINYTVNPPVTAITLDDEYGNPLQDENNEPLETRL